jgi:hypothetical protein
MILIFLTISYRRKKDMIAGTENKQIGGTAYRSNPLYAYSKAFTEAASDILTVENYDVFAEPLRAVRNNASKQALKEFFTSDVVDTNNPNLSPEDIEEAYEDYSQLFENDIRESRRMLICQRIQLW